MSSPVSVFAFLLVYNFNYENVPALVLLPIKTVQNLWVIDYKRTHTNRESIKKLLFTILIATLFFKLLIIKLFTVFPAERR